jgi:hypothetical protein
VTTFGPPPVTATPTERQALASVFVAGKALVVGLRRLEDGDLKVYVGAVWRGWYVVLPPGPDADAVEAAWADPTCHVLIPAPPPDAIHTEEPSDA